MPASNLAALRAATSRVVVAAGTTSAGQLPHRTATALAEQLHLPLITLPGGHVGTAEQPQPSADALHQLLDTDS